MSVAIFASRKWSLHNPVKGWTLHRLSLREVSILIGTLSPVELASSFVWQKKWLGWRRLAEVQLTKSTEVILAPPSVPPLPEMAAAEVAEEVTQVRPVQVRAPDVTPRRHARTKISVPVEIVKGTDFLATQTLDVSESGIRFSEPLPGWVVGYFTVIFRQDGLNFEITCALVEDQKGVKDRAEVIDTNDEESGLQKYLVWTRSL